MKNEVTINEEQRLYALPCDGGYTCLGFDVCLKRAQALAKEMREPMPKQAVGSMDLYHEYRRLVEEARQRNAKTGWRSKSELTPELIGMEHRRVEVTTEWGELVRFTVGKSTGFIPCHLMLSEERFVEGRWEKDEHDDGIGGCAVCVGKPRDVTELIA